MTFNERFKQVTKDRTPEEVCRILKISKGTYDRWILGISAPHELGREAVFTALAQ